VASEADYAYDETNWACNMPKLLYDWRTGDTFTIEVPVVILVVYIWTMTQMVFCLFKNLLGRGKPTPPYPPFCYKPPKPDSFCIYFQKYNDNVYKLRWQRGLLDMRISVPVFLSMGMNEGGHKVRSPHWKALCCCFQAGNSSRELSLESTGFAGLSSSKWTIYP